MCKENSLIHFNATQCVCMEFRKNVHCSSSCAANSIFVQEKKISLVDCLFDAHRHKMEKKHKN